MPEEPSFRHALELRPKAGRRIVVTREAIPEGAVITPMRGDLGDRPSRYSFQVGEGLHLGKSGWAYDEMLHSCRPNTWVDLTVPGERKIRALRDLAPGEELRVNYCATEEAMAEPFDCDCGEPGCYGRVRGYRFLSEDQREALRDIAAPHLRR